jgi:uncharacterized oxidoreductase
VPSQPAAGTANLDLNHRSVISLEEFIVEITNHTVLIVGGTSGIGLGLAHRFAAAGNTVIVGGRNVAAVDDRPAVTIDVTDPDSVARARDSVLASHPDLDVVVTMSGVMLPEDLRDPSHVSAAEQTIRTNLLGTIRVTDAFTPHLLGRGKGTIITVSSGIAFLPFPLMPTYAASKAGVHAYSESLRAQLNGTGVDVIELVPPAVATTPQLKQMNPNALDLDAFLDEVMTLLAQSPTPNEILVQSVMEHRWVERDGAYADLVARRSQALAMLPGR